MAEVSSFRNIFPSRFSILPLHSLALNRNWLSCVKMANVDLSDSRGSHKLENVTKTAFESMK